MLTICSASNWTSFLYILKGDLAVGPSETASRQPAFHTIVLSNDQNQTGIELSGEAGTELVLVSIFFNFHVFVLILLRLRENHSIKPLSNMVHLL